jgi:hypothetical protein
MAEAKEQHQLSLELPRSGPSPPLYTKKYKKMIAPSDHRPQAGSSGEPPVGIYMKKRVSQAALLITNDDRVPNADPTILASSTKRP